MVYPSATRVPTLEADLEAERVRRGQLESELDSTRDGARQLESLKEGSARESEEIMGALQGQVDAANKVRGLGVSCPLVLVGSTSEPFVEPLCPQALRVFRGSFVCKQGCSLACYFGCACCGSGREEKPKRDMGIQQGKDVWCMYVGSMYERSRCSFFSFVSI